MENNKYKLTNNTKELFGKVLYQIKALKSFGNIDKNELGGYIEKEANLSSSGDAWVYGDARVYGNTWVYGDAKVYGNTRVYGSINFEFGQCFGSKGKDWNVTELTNGEEILLIKDYKPSTKIEVKEMTVNEVSKLLGYEIKIKGEDE